MLAKIDTFPFIMNETHFKAMNESFKWHFAEQKQIGYSSTYQAVNGKSHSITLRGLLVQKKIKVLDELIAIADKKEPVRFTSIKDDFKIIIKSIDRGADKFNNDGSFMVQTFNLTLERLFDE